MTAKVCDFCDTCIYNSGYEITEDGEIICLSCYDEREEEYEEE
jgi:hypothetical protein